MSWVTNILSMVASAYLTLGGVRLLDWRKDRMGISWRKLSEESLRESEANFKAIANAAPVMIWMSGTDKLCNFFNKGWLDFTGRTLEKELGNGWAEGVHPDDLERCLQSYVESFEARRPFTLKYRLRRHDGEYRLISDNGAPHYGPAQNFLGYIGACMDLTEHKRSDEKFRAVVEASPNGIVLMDHENRIVLINAETEKMFGYPRKELVGQMVDMVVPEQWRAQHGTHRGEFLKAPRARMMGAGRELFGRRKDGTEFPIEVGLSPIQSSEGDLTMAAIVDISARKQAEAEAILHRNELAHFARVSTIGQLATSLAHELNQPLGAILRNAEAAELLLKDPSPDLDEVRAIVSDICKDDLRAGAVVDRIRAFMRRGEVQRRPVNLNLLVGEVVALVRLDAEMHRVRLALETDLTLKPISGDRVQLQQVVLNLLLNAIDSLSENPLVRGLVTVRAQPAGATIEVAVSDNGCGIPADNLAHVFEPFHTSKPNGLGLGLAISRSIIEAHDGKIWVENNAAGGATFTFALPASEGGDAK